MELDYKAIGKRIAQRRKKLGLKQYEVEERANISYKYLSIIERGFLHPLHRSHHAPGHCPGNHPPDSFLVGTVRDQDEAWKDVAELLRPMDEKHLKMAKSLLTWLAEEEL